MNADRVVNVGIYVNDSLVAGQQSANISRAMSPVDITNRIDGEWSQSICGVKNWRVSCQGAYMANADAYAALEHAYYNNETVSLLIQDQGREYTGEALIISFPLGMTFASHYVYSIDFLGTGALNELPRTNNEGD